MIKLIKTHPNGFIFTVRIFGIKVFSLLSSQRMGWFRIFEYGCSWKHKTHDLLFSERIGRIPGLILFNYRLHILKP